MSKPEGTDTMWYYACPVCGHNPLTPLTPWFYLEAEYYHCYHCGWDGKSPDVVERYVKVQP